MTVQPDPFLGPEPDEDPLAPDPHPLRLPSDVALDATRRLRTLADLSRVYGPVKARQMMAETPPPPFPDDTIDTVVDILTRQIETAVGQPIDEFAHNCHAAATALARSGLFGTCRVARGTCRGVMGQHSWLVLSDDPYDADAVIIDITLWSYDDTQPRVWIGSLRDGLHLPHGRYPVAARIGGIESGHGDPIPLAHPETLSPEARVFLDRLGPLDALGWMRLASGGMLGFPAREVLTAMCETPGLRALIPVDVLGMLTDVPGVSGYDDDRGAR